MGMPPVGSQEPKPPEAESSVAFEAPAEEPNLTLVVDSFYYAMHYSAKRGFAIVCRLSVRPSVRL